LQDPPKFTQIGIFGLKTNHLATLVYMYLYQGGQMLLRNNRPICSPTHFLSKLSQNFYHGKSSPRTFHGKLSILKKEIPKSLRGVNKFHKKYFRLKN
jgi:hypothetical protein